VRARRGRKSSRRIPGRRRPAEENDIFTPARSLYFQDGHDTENLDIPAVLARLDEWAAKVKAETQRHLYRVTDPRYADHYAHSEARLRAEFLVQSL